MKKLLFTIFITGQIAMAATLEYINYKDIKIPLIYEESHNLPIVSMQLVFSGSGALRDGDKRGLAKLTAKMLNEGSLKKGSSGFADALDARAIGLSAACGNETFVFELGSLRDEFPRAIELLDELLQEPNFSDEPFKKVLSITQSQIAKKSSDFDTVASEELKRLLYSGSALELPSIGTADSIKTITLDDIREFKSKNLTLSNLIIVAGGDISLSDITTHALRAISSLDAGSANSVDYIDISNSTKNSTIIKPQSEQAYIYFGSPFDMRQGDSEYYKAKVAMFILGSGGFGSRMMEEIRVKRGLAYSAYSRLDISKSHSYFNGYLQTKTTSADEAIKAVRELIELFISSGVSESELEQAKKFILGSEPLRVETLSQRLNRSFSEYYADQPLGYTATELELIKNLSLDDLNHFITRHSEIKNLTFAVVNKE